MMNLPHTSFSDADISNRPQMALTAYCERPGSDHSPGSGIRNSDMTTW